MNQPPQADLPGSGGSQPSGDGAPTIWADSTVPPRPAAPVEEEGPPTAPPPPEFPLTPPTGDELDALVSSWQSLRAHNPALPLEEVCRDRPELLSGLRRRLDVLSRFGQLGDTPPAPTDSIPATNALVADPYVTEPPDPSGSPFPEQTNSAPPGYEIVGELGRGGMGIVYKARQQVGDGTRVVALKMILSGGHAHPEEQRRFLIEAAVIAAIAHPGIVQIHDFGAHAGQPWFALEYCSGGSLAGKLKNTTLAADEAARLVEEIARAVQAAHDKGIIHRDLKPANVLLVDASVGNALRGVPQSRGTPRRAFPTDLVPKLTDFGLARRVEGGSDETKEGLVMGTPSYMPPEQARGEKVGPLADVYSLGAILYECLTGRPPFKASSVLDTLQEVIHDDLPPPRSIVPNVSRDLETIALQCLQKDPAKRYASAAELADDLNRFLTDRPILARRTPPWERALKWVRRRPTMAALIAAMLLAVLCATAGGWYYALYQEEQNKVLLARSEKQQEMERLLSQGQLSALAGRLALERKQEVDAERRLDAALRDLDLAVALAREMADEETLGRIETQRSTVVKDRSEVVSRREMQRRVEQLRKDWQNVRFLEISATERERIENAGKVLKLAEEALVRFGLPADKSPRELVRALENERARFAPGQQKEVARWCYETLLADAESVAETAKIREISPKERRRGGQTALRLLDQADALAVANGLTIPRVYHVRRARYHELAGHDKAAAEERALAAAQKPSTSLDHLLTAVELYKQGKFNLAAEECRLALDGKSDPFWPQYLLALCRTKRERWVEAQAALDTCLGLRPDFIWARLLRGAVQAEWASRLERANRPDEAAPVFEQSEKDFAQASHPKTPDPFAGYVTLRNRSVLWARRKLWRQAEADILAAIELRREDDQAWATLAEVRRLRKDLKGAIAALDKALALRPGDAGLHYSRARIYQAQNDTRAARTDYAKAIAGKGGAVALRVSARVELGVLKQRAGELDEALADFDAALKEHPDYAPAHQQKAQTLLKLDKYREAGAALDLFLKYGKPEAKDYLARGMIYSQLSDHKRAEDSFTRALLLQDSAEARTGRGWARLRLDAPRPALADFDASLAQRPGDVATLCGRGQARLMLGQMKEALLDAEEASQQEEGAPDLRVACLYARAADLVKLKVNGDMRARLEKRYRDTAADLVCAAVLNCKAPERIGFWRRRVEPEPSLAAIRRHPRVVKMMTGLGEK